MRRMPGLARAGLPAAALAAALAGCAEPTRTASTARTYFVDQQGRAQLCTVPGDVALSPDRPAEASMLVGNDGGWCGIEVSQPGPRPFAAGTVVARPAHGRLHIRTVGDVTRVDYIPDRGFAGSDRFAVAMVPGGAQLRVAVTVEPAPAGQRGR